MHTGCVKLDRNHIISAGYIRNWAVGDLVECELVPGGGRLALAPSKVGVRKKFYAGSPAADGTRSAAAAERARDAVETKALPLLRDLADRWPLRDSDERAWVAMWLAMTLCASPRQRQQIPGTVARFYVALEREAPLFAALTAGDRHELSEADFELDSMFEEVSTVASLLGQMHWTVMRFARPALISSDHPISMLPWTSDPARSAGAPAGLVLDSLEVRVPVSPSRRCCSRGLTPTTVSVPCAQRSIICAHSIAARGGRPSATGSGSLGRRREGWTIRGRAHRSQQSCSAATMPSAAGASTRRSRGTSGACVSSRRGSRIVPS